MNSPGNRGIVMVAVLLIVAIMSVMVVAVTSLTRSSIFSQRLEDRLLATELALLSGIETAKARILSTNTEKRIFFDGTPEVLMLDGDIEVEISIRDAAGLVDLNRSDLELLTAAIAESFTSNGPGLLGHIAEWRRQAATRAPGEPQAQTANTAPASGQGSQANLPAPSPIVFMSVDQLLPMVPAEEQHMLAERFTVFSPKGLVNPAAAPREVLLAIPGLTRDDIAEINSIRKTRTSEPGLAMKQMLERMATYLAIETASVFRIGVRVVKGPGVIARSEADAVVKLTETDPIPFRTLAVNGL
jgi:general secretion pathway protein K